MKTHEGQTIGQFSTFTNEEAYVEVFHRRLMKPLPDTQTTGEYWGSTTRACYYPILREILAQLCTQKQPIRLLDVGAGSGEMIDHVLKAFPAVISAIEPNPLMLERYLSALMKNNLMKDSTYLGRIQRLYQGQPGENWLKNLPRQDLILASHMIYGLTSATSYTEVQARIDLTNFLAAMYEKLAEDGLLFIAYALGENVLFGEAAVDYVGKSVPIYEENVRKIWQARNEILENGGAAITLNKIFPDYACQFSIEKPISCVYGDSMDDIAAYCILGELTQIDGAPFDVNQLRHHFDFVAKYGKEFGLQEILGGSRDGMLSVPTPQIICKIKKTRK